ncbi:unnamed protein product, partial [Mesorhabditis spiculigera]
MRTPGCWRYGWKIEPSTACYNTTALSYYNYKGKRVPMKLVHNASPGIQMLLKHHMFQMPSWLLTTPATTATTTQSKPTKPAEPKPTESDDDIRKRQSQLENSDRELYQYLLLVLSFGGALAIGVAFHELVTSGTKQFNVTYACPDIPTEPDYIVFCYTEWVMERKGHEQARIEPMGCWQYGWKRSPERRAECQNPATMAEGDLQKWPQKPIELIMPAGKGLIALADEYVKDIGWNGEYVGFTRTATRPANFVYDPEPTEDADDILKRQLQLEHADREFYQYVLIFLSVAGAVAIIGGGKLCIYFEQKKRNFPDRDPPPTPPANPTPNAPTNPATPTAQTTTTTTNEQIA